MKQRPDFIELITDFPNKTYHLTLNRSGEFVAWLLVLVLGIMDALLLSRTGSVSSTAIIFTVLFLLAALASSFSNWLERNTKISVSESGLLYRTPMRKVAMTWQEIDVLRLMRRGAGWYVMVVGDKNTFTFQTQMNVRGPFGQEAKTGVERGEQLAAKIANQVDLSVLTLDGDVWVCRREGSENSG